MPVCSITDRRHFLFTSKPDPAGFIEQCKKIQNVDAYRVRPEKILGIEQLSTATASDIKSAYKRLALRFYPDKAPDKKLAHDVFPILTDACRYLLYKKKALSDEDIENNVFHSASNFPRSNDYFTGNWFQRFNEEIFKEADGLDEDLAREFAALRQSFQTVMNANFKLNSIRIKTASYAAYNFSNECCRASVQLKKDSLLEEVKKIDTKIVTDGIIDDHDLRYQELVDQHIESVQRNISGCSALRLKDLERKERFLQDPHTRLQVYWDAMIKKTKELQERAKHNANYIKAAKTAVELRESLENAYQVFLKSTNDYRDKEKFSNICLEAINKARPELIKHRGWKQLLTDLTLNLLIFVGTLSLSMMVTGKFRFFTFKTDSELKLDALEKSLNGVITVPGWL